MPDSPTPNPRYLIWHPSVHALFRDELAFFMLTLSTFPKDIVLRQLEELLETTGHTTYRIYRVFGTYDLFLKVWVHRGGADELGKNLERSLEYIKRATPLVVESIPHHWKYKDLPSSGAISRLSADLIRPIQECFTQPDTWTRDPVRKALDNLLLRIVEETTGKIMFFTGIRCPDADGLDVKALLEHIYSLFREFESELENTAVYKTKESFLFLLKFESTNFFRIGAFITELSDKLAVSRCATVTSVVVDQAIRGREEIGWRSIQQVRRFDLPTLNILPELYEIDGIAPQKQAQFEAWINQELVPHRDGLGEQEFKGIQACLLAVLNEKEADFLSTIMLVYGPIERELRALQGKFIAKLMGPDNVAKTVQEALRRNPNAESKKIELLSLGDRLDVYVYVIKAKGLSTDPMVLDSWAEEAQLRDAAAHFSEKPFPNWYTILPILVRFLQRYKKLLSIIRGTVNGSS